MPAPRARAILPVDVRDPSSSSSEEEDGGWVFDGLDEVEGVMLKSTDFELSDSAHSMRKNVDDSSRSKA